MYWRRQKKHRIKAGSRKGLVRAFNGSGRGKEIDLSGVLHTFGTPGKQNAVINARPRG